MWVIENINNHVEHRNVFGKMTGKLRNNEKQNNPIPKIYISEVYAQQARSVAREQAFKAALEIKANTPHIVPPERS